jgi:hypothetical protein
MKGKCVAVLCGAMVLGWAVPAHALRAYVNYDSLVVSAANGEKNNLTIQPDPTGTSSFLITDIGNGAQAGAGCVKTARVLRCTLSPDYPPSLSLSLGDQADTAKVEGGFYYSQVDGGGGNDNLDLRGASTFGSGGSYVSGGWGADTIDTRNGTTDTVDCGTGPDTAKTDFFDYRTSC